MPLRIISKTGLGVRYGVALAESGINVSSFNVRYFPEVDKTYTGLGGVALVRAVSQNFSRTVEIDGEVLTPSAGLMLFTLASALSFANQTRHFAPVAGTFYLDEATVTANRHGWLIVKIKATAKHGI